MAVRRGLLLLLVPPPPPPLRLLLLLRNETAVTFWPNWPWTDSSDSFHDRGHDGNLGNFAGR